MEKHSFSNIDSVGDLILSASRILATSDSSRLDSELLLAHVLRTDRTGLLVRFRETLSDEHVNQFGKLVDRRRSGEPVAYIVGEKEFYGRSFEVNPSVLIPRPESELLVDEALASFALKKTASILDLGTGSGCLAVSLTSELLSKGVDARSVAVDRSAEALAVARKNAQRYGTAEAIEFVESDWYSSLEGEQGRFDVIVANPPYVVCDEPLARELSFEPPSALFSAEEGLCDARQIIEGATQFLQPEGVLLCEVGAYKMAHVERLLAEYRDLYRISYLGDQDDLDRFLVLRLERM